MLAQRKRTDSIIMRLKKSEDLSLLRFPGEYDLILSLISTRSVIDSGRMNKDGVMHYYTNAITG